VPDVLRIEDHQSVRLLVLDRPEMRNALSGDLITALHAALLEADDDPRVRAVVLSGSDPAFCAGVDLKQAAREGAAYFARYQDANCIEQVALMRTPVVGAVNGAAFTGGLEIALGCDLLVASERAVFADTHARVGVLPGGGMTARLPQLIGAGNARRLSMTGEVVDAARALRMDLVTEVVAHEQLVPHALDLARSIAEVEPEVMLALKQMYTEGWTRTLGAALDVESQIANAHPPAYERLEQRRQEVLVRNRSQL
jgi:enoyl-CoA hydratase